MWHADFVAHCQASPTPINDAAGYGVTIQPAITSPGDAYWRIIGVHHLTPQENAGKNHLYLDALDQAGNRVYGTRIAWGWQGQTPDEIQRTQPVVIDKPVSEPGGNIGLHAGQVVWARVAGALSDMIVGVHTGHDDEPNGNFRFHHSFDVVYQVTIATGQQPDPDPDPPPDPTPQPYTPLDTLTIWRFYGNQGWIPVWTGSDIVLAGDEYFRHVVEAGKEEWVYLMVKAA